MKRFIASLVFCLLGLALQAAGAAERVVIRLPEKAAVVGPEMSLGEIAEIITGDKATADRLRRLTLGKAAPAGREVKITLGFIKIALRREGYSLDDFAFGGEATVEVKTQSQALDPSDLLKQAKDFILVQTREIPENVDVTLEGMEKKILLPAGKVTAHFRPPLTGRYEGTVFLTAELEVDGRQVRVLPVRALVEIYRPAVTVLKKIEKGEKFIRDNVGVVRTPSSKMINGSFPQLGYVLDRTAALPLMPGTVVRVNDFYDPPVIHQGQVVQGVVNNGNIELTVQVRAVEDGKAGDKIRVENTESHKLLRGKILDEKTVLIEADEVR
jgi:flagella basal body P-ring formation protein FlgA